MYELILRSGDSLTAAETNQLKCIWMECFGDSKDYLDMFFDVFIPHIEVVLGIEDGVIIATSYMLPLHTSSGRKCAYLYAGGVAKDYRGRHLFRPMVEYHTGSFGNDPYYIVGVPHLIEWYKSTYFPVIYTCRELTLSVQTSKALSCQSVLTRCCYTLDKLKELREAYLKNVNYEYICYPDWFYHLMRTEKEYCEDVMDILSDATSEYYVIGRYKEGILYIDETSLPAYRLKSLSQALCSFYRVDCIKIKLPLSDNESDKESSIIYAGQGSSSGNLWAPFTLE